MSEVAEDENQAGDEDRSAWERAMDDLRALWESFGPVEPSEFVC